MYAAQHQLQQAERLGSLQGTVQFGVLLTDSEEAIRQAYPDLNVSVDKESMHSKARRMAQ